MDRFMAWLHSKLFWLPMLGGGKRWIVKGKTVYLWPFVALAIFIVILLAYNQLFG